MSPAGARWNEPPPRPFAIVYEADDDEPDATAIAAGYGFTFADGSTVFVWSRRRDGRRSYGEFGSAERALCHVEVLGPAELVWFDQATH